MSLAADFEVKGWCPGALRPMPSGDGLLARIRPWCGAFTLDQALGLAGIAARLGNGHLDVTRRANLQIRGLTEEDLPDLQRALDRLSLLDANAESEAARNIMVGPLAGAEARSLAAALGRALAADPRAKALPAKFGWLVDDGGPLSILGERADIALYVKDGRIAVRAAGDWLAIDSLQAALSLAFGERITLPKAQVTACPGRRRLGTLTGVTGLAAPFGRLEARQLEQLVAAATRAGASEIRLSPWRALYVDADLGETAGLIIDESDPILRVDACPGMPACASSTVDTRHAARLLAETGFAGSIHVSGCAKGCARSAPADLVLVGERGRFGVIHQGTTHDRPEGTLDPDDVMVALHG